MALKENYKDDILDVSQNVKRKYQMENNGDGTVSFTDVTEYTQQGDSFGASDMNATNGKVNTLESDIGEINDNLTASNQTAGVTDVPFRFGCTDDGKFGYIINQGGADSVIPFSEAISHLSILNTYAQGYQSGAACTLFCDTFEDFESQPTHSETSRTSGTNINQYLSVIIAVGAGGGYYFDTITVKALLSGKYRLLGTGDNINRIIDANVGDTLITCRSNNGTGTAWQSYPSIGNNANNGKALFIQYLG